MGCVCAGEGALLSPLSLSVTNRGTSTRFPRGKKQTKKEKEKARALSVPRGKVRPKKAGGVATGGRRDVGTDDGSPG